MNGEGNCKMTTVELIEELTDIIERQNKVIKELTIQNSEQADFIEDLLLD